MAIRLDIVPLKKLVDDIQLVFTFKGLRMDLKQFGWIKALTPKVID